MAKISVIIPAYIDMPEKEQWLKEAVESARKQTYGNVEIVIVDDASPIPVKYGDVIRLNENVGTAIARNTAAHHATGELLFPLDADDLMYPNTLELLYNGYEKNHFIYGNVTVFGEKPEQTTDFPPFDCRNVLNLGGVFPVSCLHSKESHLIAGGWKSKLKDGLEDVEYWISMVRQCNLGININKPVLKYRQHPFSRTKKLEASGNKGTTMATIRKIHEDLYGGADMPCPGCGSRRKKPIKQSSAIVSTNLMDYPDSMLMTIQYNGPRQGKFGIVGPTTGVSYRIEGTNSQLQIHKDDWGRFKNLDAGKAFEIVTMARPQPIQPNADNYKPPEPEIANTPKITLELEQLDMSQDIINKLRANGWTVEKLATECRVGDLRPIAGIGPKTEIRITNNAKALYFK